MGVRSVVFLVVIIKNVCRRCYTFWEAEFVFEGLWIRVVGVRVDFLWVIGVALRLGLVGCRYCLGFFVFRESVVGIWGSVV